MTGSSKKSIDEWSSLAKKELGWKPKIHIKTLIKEMVTEELKNLSDD